MRVRNTLHFGVVDHHKRVVLALFPNCIDACRHAAVPLRAQVLDQRLHLGTLGKNCRTERDIRLGVFCVSEKYIP